MQNIVQFDLDQRVKEFYPPIIHPPEDYQYEKSKKYRRKRRSIYPSYMPELRIMRHDIRRKYGDMFVNLSNSCDIGLMTRFFGEFVRPDCVIDRVSPQSNIYKNIHQISFTAESAPESDIEKFLHGFAMRCDMTTQVLRIQECQVRTRQGSQGSLIVLKTLATSVQLFAPNSSQIKGNNSKLLCDCFDLLNDIQSSSKNSSSTPDSTPSSDELSMSEDILLPSSLTISKVSEEYNLTLVRVPVETVAAILFILVLDENHFIRKIYLEDKLISEKPLNQALYSITREGDIHDPGEITS